ncbi:hypothetical protein INT43_002958 [Umbelopsis isabellina]|uniref:Calcium channel YVC1 n=1 Tax=Mortierella isabellina TaxID=91625 RepID=A0A8H7U6M1_MORIS|nr:hypothetical protein INT43_002958 [Umbelopsis isabellina]
MVTIVESDSDEGTTRSQHNSKPYSSRSSGPRRKSAAGRRLSMRLPTLVALLFMTFMFARITKRCESSCQNNGKVQVGMKENSIIKGNCKVWIQYQSHAEPFRLTFGCDKTWATTKHVIKDKIQSNADKPLTGPLVLLHPTLGKVDQSTKVGAEYHSQVRRPLIAFIDEPDDPYVVLYRILSDRFTNDDVNTMRKTLCQSSFEVSSWPSSDSNTQDRLASAYRYVFKRPLALKQIHWKLVPDLPLFRSTLVMDHNEAEECGEHAPLLSPASNLFPKSRDITDAIERLILLVTIRLPKFAVVERDDLEDAVVNDKFAEVARKACDINRDVLIFVALKAMERFQIQSQGSPRWSELLETRASICESLAHKFIRLFDRENTEVFAAAIMQKHDLKLASDQSAVELAVQLHASKILLEPKVQRVIHDVWNGHLLPIDYKEGRVYFKTNTAMARMRNGFFDPAKIHVPKYANAIETFITILFLVLYTIVINDGRSHVPTVLEWVMYLFVLGDVLDDIRDIYNTGMFHYYSFWACTNTLTHLVFIASFILRMIAMSHTGSEKDMLNNTSLDVLSVVSILLWFRVLSVVCNTWRYFGSYTIIVQSMLSDALMFFFLLIWVIFGFFQAFIALRTENTAQDNDFSEIAALLMRGYLMAPDFDKAEMFHGEIGEPLFYAYIFLVSVVLQSFLTSVFSDSFSRISEDAKAQYLSNFAYRVITAVDSRKALPPPFNLIEIVCLGLPYLVLKKKNYEKLRYYFLMVLFCIPLLIVTFHEKMLLQLDNARADDSLSDDDGNMNEEQDFTTANDEHVKGLKDLVGQENLEQVVTLAASTLKSSKESDRSSASGNEMLHSDIKRVVKILDTINDRLQRLESNAQTTS